MSVKLRTFAQRLFTSSGYNARRSKTHSQVGMVGINVGVPAPMAVFPFAGSKQSFFGDPHVNGEDAAKLYTEGGGNASRRESERVVAQDRCSMNFRDLFVATKGCEWTEGEVRGFQEPSTSPARTAR